jgi:hypothetical protein
LNFFLKTWALDLKKLALTGSLTMMAIMNPKTVDGQHEKNSNGLEVYEWDPVDEAAWQAWARSYGLSRNAG